MLTSVRHGTKVIMAMSGGVDSAISAKFLRDAGIHVQPVYMCNWNDYNDDIGSCRVSGERDWYDVQRTCSILGLPPPRRLNFSREYWTDVFVDFVLRYERGETPNPDVLCNQAIKFGVLKRWALEHGFDKIATGHYARIDKDLRDGKSILVKAVDTSKDQTYFLSHLHQDALDNALFPISHLLKSQVKQIAASSGLSFLFDKKESMGLCFVGANRNFPQFLGQYIRTKPGKLVMHDCGTVIGEHKGLAYYTLGQKARIGGQPNALYVAAKDKKENIIYVVDSKKHPSLYCTHMIVREPHWISASAPSIEPLRISIRSSDKLGSPARISWLPDARISVDFDTAQYAPAPGQCAVFYHDNICLGGGWIDNVDKQG